MPDTLTVEALVEQLEHQIDPVIEDDLHAQWRRFWAGEGGDPCVIRRRAPRPRAGEWPTIHINDAIESPEQMAMMQLEGCARTLEGDSGRVLCVRSNFGVGILPTLFGARPYIMAREQNCLPNSCSLGGAEAMRALLDRGVPDLKTGYGARVFETSQILQEALSARPNCRQYVHVYHPDLQGPMDVLELLWGSDIFVDLYDEPDLVHACLGLICDTYAAFMRRWWEIVPPEDGLNPHWGLLHKGRIVLRDDSAMNLSPAMFEEFIAPYDERLLLELGGGGIHACGKVDHYIEPLSRIQGLTFFNMSQPHLNDMETVYRHTVDKGLPLLGFSYDAAQETVRRGRPLHGKVQCG